MTGSAGARRALAGEGGANRWTHRAWFLPWLQIALASGLAASRSSPLLVLLSAGVLGWVPILSGPLVHRRWVSWLVLLSCGFWWAGESLSGSSPVGYFELVGIGGWSLVLLACVQILSLGRGGSAVLVSWCALGAVTMFADHRGVGGAMAMIVQGILSVESLRHPNAVPGASGAIARRWVASLVVLAGLVALQQSINGASRLGGSDWGESRRIKGFSTITRLGTFGTSYLPDLEGEIAVRVWAARPPFLLKGMVHDLYSNGAWIATPSTTVRQPERMNLDFSQFCREKSDSGAPMAWASSPDEHLPVLFAPTSTGCVGVVADSLRISSQGVFLAPPEGFPRGWSWYSVERADTATGHGDLRVSKEWFGLLDSLWWEIDSSPRTSVVGDPGARAQVEKLAGWFDKYFRYDLDVPQESGIDPLRMFLRHRRGYCEYYATASVLLLRRGGIRARYVTGLSGPEAVSGGQWWLYRQGGAHAWVEWKPEGGSWETFDPTPSSPSPVAERSGWSRVREIASGWGVTLWHGLRDGAWRARLDGWQTRLESTFSWGWGALGGVGAAAVAWLFWRAWRRAPRNRGRWESELAGAEARIRRQGQVRAPGETIGAFLARLPQNADPRAVRILLTYQQERWKCRI